MSIPCITCRCTTWVLKCWSSFPTSDSLWHQWRSHVCSSPCGMLPAHLLTGWWKLCHHNAGPEAGYLQWPGKLLPWVHPLPWLQWSNSEKEWTRCKYEVCIQVWVLLPWQGICLEILLPRCQRKVRRCMKRRRSSGQSGERGTSSLNTIPGCGGWSSPFSVLWPPHRCTATPQRQLWLSGAHYLRHDSSQWDELPREKGTG